VSGPGPYNLVIYRGDTATWEFVLWEDAAKTVPFDLTNATAKAEIRNRPGGVLLVTLTTSITMPNIINVFLTEANSLALNGGVFAWDLPVTMSGGTVQTMVAGPVTVTEDVTGSV
jgi:hypothetical protein